MDILPRFAVVIILQAHAQERYCIDGATRSATMLTIQGENGYIKKHNSAEAYRSNYDIVDWILNHI